MRKMAYYPLKGGENLIVPALSSDPGQARFTRNYELDRYGRYRRIDGYERFDGSPKPSDASYWLIDFESGDAELNEGETLTGDTSTATGEVLEQVLESGTYAGGDAAGYIVLTGVSGTFQNGENLQESAATVAVSSGLAYEKGADDDDLHDEYLQAAIEAARDKIYVVPGSGSVLGVWVFDGDVYAFRNASGNASCNMYKSSASGWTLCDLGESIAFTSGGTTEIEVDDTITGATSGATATVKQVILSSGTWAGGDAAGTFILYGQTGTFQSENLNVGALSNLATIAGNSTENTLQPNGKFEFINYNFTGHSGNRKMYGCDGVSKAFEWDGSTFVPITTGMTTDTPEHIWAHKSHLFLSFSGGSLQHSSITDPYTWSVVTGAAEIGIGDDIVGIIGIPGAVLAIKSRNSTWLLYGSSSSGDDAWNLQPHSLTAGAIEWTNQIVENKLVSFDDRGIAILETTDQYGDFASSTISAAIEPYLKDKTDNVVCSMAVRAKNQYRLFFDDGQAIYMTMDGGSVLGFTRILFDDTPTCCCSSEDSSGNEVLFFGDSSGYVYQLDKGNSFDGDEIEAILRTHYNHLSSPQQKKRIRKLSLELDTIVETEIKVSCEFDYGSKAGSEQQTFDVSAGGGIWDVDAWDAFVWDGQDVSSANVYIDGTGLNFALLLYSYSAYSEPHTLQGVTVQYSPRGIQR